MRILYFARDYTPHDHRFLSAAAEAGHQVYLLRLEREDLQREDRPVPSQVEQIHWSGGRQPFHWRMLARLLLELRSVIRRLKPDLIHAGPIQKTAFLAALSGFQPLVSMSWGSDLLLDADRSKWMHRITDFTLKRTTVLMGDCEAVRQKACSLGFPTDRFVLFPWGVDLQVFSPGEGDGLRKRLGWEQAFVLLCLRAWEPLYGVDVVVRAFVRAAEQIPQLRLILLGNGSQAAELRSILLNHGMMERVYFGGQVSNRELPRFYRAADLYLSASHSDGSSVSLMEALACGKPVVVSDIPGNREWITSGEQGWLFPDGDVDALAMRLREAVLDPHRLATMGAAARRLAEERADWTRNAAKMLEGYELALRLHH